MRSHNENAVTTAPTLTAGSPAFITIHDVMQRYGVTRYAVYRWTHLRQIPFYRIGRELRFRLDELERWEAEHAVPMERNALKGGQS